jgi:hypothetical protein
MVPDLSLCTGRAIAQAVTRWLRNTADRDRSQVKSCGICGGQIGAGARFLRVLQFPLPIIIPLTARHCLGWGETEPTWYVSH